MPLSRAKKEVYLEKLRSYLDTYNKMFMVTVDHVGSNQMQQIRIALRKHAVVIMGKNTMMRKVLRKYLVDNPGHPYEQVLNNVKGNVGFVFTNGNLADVKTMITENKVPAPARSGTIAPNDVMVPSGPTGMDPGSTAFFQALNIPTKIAKGQVEIITELQLITKGEKCLPGQVVLLNKLNILPFSYGLIIIAVYDNGAFFSPEVLDMSPQDLQNKFMGAVAAVAAISLELGYPTLASLPHSISNAFQKIAAIGLEVEFDFPQMSLLTSGGGGGGGGGDAAPAAGGDDAPKEAAKEEEEEDVGLGGGADMFAGGDDY